MAITSILFLTAVFIISLSETGQCYWRRRGVSAYVFLAIILAVGSAVVTYTQYFAWQVDGFARFFLPPHRSWSYFIQYALFHFWAHYLVALVFSLIILALTLYFNKRHGERYFWPEEPYFIALAILAVGYPGWLIYFLLILITPLLFSIFYFLFSKKMPRISYYHLWLPLAIITIIASQWLEQFQWWSKLLI